MRKIALFSVWSSDHCYECGGSKELELISTFEEISDEDFKYITKAISKQKYSDNPKYVMIEQTTVKEVKEDIKSILAKFKKEEQELLEAEIKRQNARAKQTETLRKKREERERKKLEELKKKYGE